MPPQYDLLKRRRKQQSKEHNKKETERLTSQSRLDSMFFVTSDDVTKYSSKFRCPWFFATVQYLHSCMQCNHFILVGSIKLSAFTMNPSQSFFWVTMDDVTKYWTTYTSRTLLPYVLCNATIRTSYSQLKSHSQRRTFLPVFLSIENNCTCWPGAW